MNGSSHLNECKQYNPAQRPISHMISDPVKLMTNANPHRPQIRESSQRPFTELSVRFSKVRVREIPAQLGVKNLYDLIKEQYCTGFCGFLWPSFPTSPCMLTSLQVVCPHDGRQMSLRSKMAAIRLQDGHLRDTKWPPLGSKMVLRK